MFIAILAGAGPGAGKRRCAVLATDAVAVGERAGADRSRPDVDQSAQRKAANSAQAIGAYRGTRLTPHIDHTPIAAPTALRLNAPDEPRYFSATTDSSTDCRMTIMAKEGAE